MNYMRYISIYYLVLVAVSAGAMQQEKSSHEPMFSWKDSKTDAVVSVSVRTFKSTLDLVVKAGKAEDPYAYSLVLLRHLATGDRMKPSHDITICSSKGSYLRRLKNYYLVNQDGSIDEDVKKIVHAVINVDRKFVEVKTPADLKPVAGYDGRVTRKAAPPVSTDLDDECGGVEYKSGEKEIFKKW